MPIYNVGGIGAVRLPEGLSEQEYELIVRRLQEKSGGRGGAAPEFGMGQTAGFALQRGIGGLGISSLLEFPALALTGVEKLTGSEAAGRGAESLLGTAAEARQRLGEIAPQQYESFEQPKGVGQTVKYGVERIFEGLPSVGLAMTGGSIPVLMGRQAAQRIGAAAAEKALAGGAARETAEAVGQKAAERLLQRRAFAGSAGAMYPATAAEPFTGIYERTGEREFVEPALAGAASTILEGIVPTSLLGNLGAFGKLKASERLLDRAGFKNAAADIALRTAGVGAAEGLTETAQQAITNLAIQAADSTFNAFGPERTKEYLESFIGGALVGGTLGGAGAAVRRMRLPSEKETKAVERLQELATPPQEGAGLTEAQLLEPPAGTAVSVPPSEALKPVTPTDLAKPITPPAVTPVEKPAVAPATPPAPVTPPPKPVDTYPGQQLFGDRIRYMGEDVDVQYRAIPDGRLMRVVEWPTGEKEQTFLYKNENNVSNFFGEDVGKRLKLQPVKGPLDALKDEAQSNLQLYDAPTGEPSSTAFKTAVPQPQKKELVQSPQDLGLEFLHGTSPENKQEILRTGKFDTAKGERQYSYSQFGNKAVYFAPRSSWWLDKEKAEAGRAVSYDEQVGVEIDPSAKIAVVQSINDLNSIAKMVGLKNATELMRVLSVENLDMEAASTKARKQTLAQFIKDYVDSSKDRLIQNEAKYRRDNKEAMRIALADIQSIENFNDLVAYENSIGLAASDPSFQRDAREYLSDLEDQYKTLRSGDWRKELAKAERLTDKIVNAGIDGVYIAPSISEELRRKRNTNVVAHELAMGFEPAAEQLAMFNLDKVKPKRTEGMAAPAPFGEPIKEFGTKVVTEAEEARIEIDKLVQAIDKFQTQAEKGTSLFAKLIGKLTPEEVADITPDPKRTGFFALSAGKGRGFDLSTLVTEGYLDAFMPVKGEELADKDLKYAVENIKERLRQGKYITHWAEVELQRKRERLKQLEEDVRDLIDEDDAIREIDNALAELEQAEIDEETGGPLAPDADIAFEAGLPEPPVRPGGEVIGEKTQEQLRFQLKGLKAQRSPSVAHALRRTLGKKQATSTAAFDASVDKDLEQFEKSQAQVAQTDRKRGAAAIQQTLEDAVRKGQISEEAANFATWFIKRNPSLVDDLGIDVLEKTGKFKDVRGAYNVFERLMYLVDSNVDTGTAVHEILHHLERVMPADVQSKIMSAWARSLVKASRRADQLAEQSAQAKREKLYLDLLMQYHFGDPQLASDAMLAQARDMIGDFDLPFEMYQYFDAGEFWAVNGERILADEFKMGDGIIAKLRKWLRDVAEYIKDFFNLPSDAPIIRALKSLADADGTFKSEFMLFEGPQPTIAENVVARPAEEADFRLQMSKAADLLDGSPRQADRGLRMMIEATPKIEQGVTSVRQAVKDFTTDNADMLLSFLNLRQLGKAAENILPQMMQYYRKTSEMLTFRDNRLVRAAQLVERWDKWANANPNEGKALSTVLLKARLSGLRPTRDLDLQKIKDQEFLAAWQKIKGTEGEQIFKEIDRFFRTSAQLYYNALRKRVGQAIENKQARRLAFDMIKAEYNKFLSGGFYFPFSRFGDYWVAYKHMNNVPAYYMFESQADQRNFIEKTVNPKLKAGEIKDFKSGVKTPQMISDGVAMSEFMTKLMGIIDDQQQANLFDDNSKNAGAKQALKDTIWQLYLTMGPDLSVQKHFIHAKKVEGYSVDALRAFSESAFHGTYHLARITYGGDLDRILLDARNLAANEPDNERGRYLRELQKHHEDFSSPQGGNQYVSALTNFGFMFYLSAPASAIVNLSQVPIVAAPYMAAYFKKSHLYTMKQLGAAAKEFMASRKGGTFDLPAYLLAQSKNKALSDSQRAQYREEYQAINRLLGTLNRTQTLSLAGIAERPSALFATGIKGAMRTKALTKYQKVRIALGYMFNQAELFNRQVTALAAYRMAMESKNRDGDAKYSTTEAVEVARDIVDETHFEYAAETKARFMRGPYGQLVFQFMNYAQQMTALLVTSLKHAVYMDKNELARLTAIANDKSKSEEERNAAKETIQDMEDIKREARKRLSGILFMTMVFSGYEGLPVLPFVISTVAGAFLGDEDEPYNFKLEAKAGLAELFGDNAARILSRGLISEVTQMDWASRTSLDGLWFRDNVTSKDEAEWLRNQLVDALGPAVGMFVGVAEGIKKINDGYTMRGIETMMPPILKDGFKAFRFATEGATTLRGDPIVADVGLYGMFVQLMGFTPQEVARGQEARGEILSITQALDRRRSNIMNRLWIAHRNGDTEAYDEIADEIIDFNSKNPDEEISEETVRRSFAQRQRISDRAVQGLSLPERRQYLLKKIEYAEED